MKCLLVTIATASLRRLTVASRAVGSVLSWNHASPYLSSPTLSIQTSVLRISAGSLMTTLSLSTHDGHHHPLWFLNPGSSQPVSRSAWL